ncbi:MAG: AtpZ/AtpI family protein [Nitriliruptoraceae bacterium]
MPPSPRVQDERHARSSSEMVGRAGLWKGIDQAHIMGVELMAAILTWAGIGYLLDRWLGTDPWFLATGALLGNAAGIYLIWMRSSRMSAADDRARDQHRLDVAAAPEAEVARVG